MVAHGAPWSPLAVARRARRRGERDVDDDASRRRRTDMEDERPLIDVLTELRGKHADATLLWRFAHDRCDELTRACATLERTNEDVTTALNEEKRRGVERERKFAMSSEELRKKFNALERRVMETESRARRRLEEATTATREREAMKRALNEANREIGRLQVENVGGRSDALVAVREEHEKERRRLMESASAAREELAEAKGRVVSLEAHAREAKRVIGEALNEEFPESVDVAEAARRAVSSLSAEARRGATASSAEKRSQRSGDAGTDGTQRLHVTSSMRKSERRRSTYDVEDDALDAETEAALKEALETARRWKSVAEREQQERGRVEEDLERMRVKFKACKSSLKEMENAKLESDAYEAEMEQIIESLRESINRLATESL